MEEGERRREARQAGQVRASTGLRAPILMVPWNEAVLLCKGSVEVRLVAQDVVAKDTAQAVCSDGDATLCTVQKRKLFSSCSGAHEGAPSALLRPPPFRPTSHCPLP